MNDMIIMGRLNAHAHLYGNADSLLERQPGLFFDIFFEGNALHKLHDDIVNTVLLAYIIYIYNIGMHQSGSRLGLCTEFRYKIGVFAEFLLQDFDRHKTVQLMTFCLVYIRHTAGTDFLQYLITVSYHHSNLNHIRSPIYIIGNEMRKVSCVIPQAQSGSH